MASSSQINREMSQLVTIKRISKKIAIITFDRGDGINALSRQAMVAITEAFIELRSDPYINVIILTGTDKVFSVGADLKDPELAFDNVQAIEERLQALKVGPDMCDAVESVDPVVICAMEGYCIGGGFALAVACDLRVGSSSLKMAVPEIKLGMNMSWGSVPRTVNIVGRSKAMRIIAVGEFFDATQALEWGVIDYLAEGMSAFEQAMSIAGILAEYDTVPLRSIKRSVTESARALNSATSFADREQFALSALSKNTEKD